MNTTINYALKIKTPLSYEDAKKKVTQLLKEEGFGILTEIDVAAVLKEKIDVDFRKYVILGACNPTFAHLTMSAEPLTGVFLPCNVIVYEEGEGSVIAAMNPYMMAQVIDDETVVEVGQKVGDIFSRILGKIGTLQEQHS